jgi:hypothetical protein
LSFAVIASSMPTGTCGDDITVPLVKTLTACQFHPRTMTTRALRIAIALTFFLNAVASALEVREHRWNFDGKAVPGRFNMLSVRVYEPGPKSFDGEIALIETRGIGSGVGAPLAQQIYVTPGTERWVQFVPFVAGDFGWTVRWGKGEKEKVSLDAPGLGPPATVLLIDPEYRHFGEQRLKGFPSDLFPTSVAATDALDQLVIDHAPRWDAPRRDAFMDWMRRGGVVHILRGPTGFPEFEGDLAPLNTTVRRDRVGAGMVVRHDITREECSADYLKSEGFAPRRDAEKVSNQSYAFVNFDQNVLKGLAALTKPEVSWWLLYLLTIAYLVIIGPVHYRWSRNVDYRIAIGGFLGTVTVFALAFIIAGRRGSGETQRVHSLALARALPGGRWDTMQWISAFATSGDYYRFTHASPVNYYSASNDMEPVNGKVIGGKDGHFDVDIPLYSARPFLYRGVLSGPDFGVQVSEWKPNRIALQVGKAFPESPKEVWIRLYDQILREDRLWPLREEGNLWVGRKENAMSVDSFFSQDHSRVFNAYEWNNSGLRFDIASRPLLATFFGDVNGVQYRYTMRELAADQLQLYVYAKAPESFAMKGKGFRSEVGWVLYVQDVFRGNTPAN